MQNQFSSLLIAVFCVLFLLSSCSSVREEYSLKRDAILLREEIARELSGILSLQDAKAKTETLEKLFIHLACLMIEVDEFQEKNKIEWDMTDVEKGSSAVIFQQMERLFSIPGVQEIIEKSQEKGFRRVEKYYHLKKKKAETAVML